MINASCLVRKKEILAKPEEIIRQLWLQRLKQRYGYAISRLAVEYPITFGRDTSKRADIVIFDALEMYFLPEKVASVMPHQCVKEKPTFLLAVKLCY